jgi:hypothetical protein
VQRLILVQYSGKEEFGNCVLKINKSAEREFVDKEKISLSRSVRIAAAAACYWCTASLCFPSLPGLDHPFCMN